MHIAFRTDASLQIGTGHVMRCLTLADALRERGAQSTFICRPHAGHLFDLFQQRGHMAKALAPADDAYTAPADECHAKWLGTDWANDAAQTQQALGDQVVDWLVVDHYALDRRWEQTMRTHTRRIMAIDDLADRPHDCDLLLDQNLGHQALDYRALVPTECRLLCGSKYALLRPDFASIRKYSLQRRVLPELRELLITMGGVDKDNATAKVLQMLRACSLPEDCKITVVLGLTAPWLDTVNKLAQAMPRPTRVLSGVSNMARLMADSDLAIGAAGSTAWELCCLGVPNLLVCTAANQASVITALASIKATLEIDIADLCYSNEHVFCTQFALLTSNLAAYAAAAAGVTDGNGVHSVIMEFE